MVVRGAHKELIDIVKNSVQETKEDVKKMVDHLLANCQKLGLTQQAVRLLAKTRRLIRRYTTYGNES